MRDDVLCLIASEASTHGNKRRLSEHTSARPALALVEEMTEAARWELPSPHSVGDPAPNLIRLDGTEVALHDPPAPDRNTR
jgi:hypothetical protein